MKIATLLKLSLAVVTAFSIIGLFSMLSLYSYIVEERQATHNQAVFKQLGKDLMAASDDLTNWARAYAQYGNREYYTRYMDELETVKRREAVVEGLRRLNAPKGEQDLVQKALDLSNTLAVLEIESFKHVAGGNFENARALLFGPEYERGKRPIIDTLQEFEKVMNGRAERDARQAQENATRVYVAVAVVFVVIFAAVLLCFVSIYVKLRPIKRLVEVTRSLAEGNFRIRVDLAGQDEFGLLAGHFSDFIDNVAAVLKDSKIAVGDTMDANSSLVTTMRQFSHTFRSQTMQVANVAATMEEMSTTSEQIKGKVLSAMEDVGGVLTLAQNGVERLDQIRGQMDHISGKTEQLAATIHELGAASEKIGDILKVIDAIAGQTNLLAVNAAIEAARAGSAGKGFAIVADEVRKLAERTQRETAQIINIITSLQESSTAAISEMNETETSIGIGADIIAETQRSFLDIAAGTENANKNVSHVRNSVSEQVEAIAGINDHVQAIAAGVEECATAVAQVTETTAELQHKAVTAFDAIGFFKV